MRHSLARRCLSSVLLAGVLAALIACGGGLGGSSQSLQDRSLWVDPTSINFGPVAIGADVQRTVTLMHKGTEGTIRLTGVERGPGTSEEFTWDELPVKELNPGDSTTLVIHYRPEEGSAVAGTIVVRHDVPDAYKTVISVSAVGQVGELTPVPPIDFDKVPMAECPKTRDFELKNLGTKAVRIDSMALKSQGDPSAAFELHPELVTPGGQPLPLDLNPGEAIGFVVTFKPLAIGCYEDERLWVYSGVERYEFDVRGCEVGPRVEVMPGLIDFKWVAPGATVTQPMIIRNSGEYDLEVTDVLPFVGSDPGLTVIGGPVAGSPWTLVQDEERTVTVSWTASLGVPPVDGKVGTIHVISSDLNASPTSIDVLGELDVPSIAPDPEIIDFGYVAQGITAERYLYIDNAGHGTLTVTGLQIVKSMDTLDEFAIAPDPEFPPTTGAGPGTVPGFETKAVKLTFKNKGPAEGCVTVTMYVESDSPGAESWPIALKACRSGTPTCEPRLVPVALNFGTLAVGTVVEKTMLLRNIGTGNCKFQGVKIVDCTATMPPPFPPTCPQPFAGGASKIFTTPKPPPLGEVMGPGGEVPIDVRYTAPAATGMFGMVTSFQAVLGVKVIDENIPGQPEEITIPTAAAANLIGGSGVPKISVVPGEVKFGLVTLGCHSKTYKICISNSGSAALTVSDISLQGCSPEFKLKDVPPLPMDVKPGVPQCIGAVYVPQQEASQSCAVRISSNDKTAPDVSVKLSGTGTYEEEQTDEFTQVAGQSVDVLFVIDDSGSMCTHQDLLADNIDHFIQNAEIWKNDFHLGVVTTNVTDEEVAGKLNRGETQPRYVIPGPGAQSTFAEFAKVGCEGGSDSQEAGFEPMQIALSAPLATDTGKPCGSDADCKNDQSLCGDPASCPYRCLDNPEKPGVKTCGGWNKGFLREDAKLEVIVLADEDDQSPAAPSFYIDFLRNIKGYYNVGWARLHAIVWQDSCGEPPVSQTTGDRYMMVAAETGGKVGEICKSDYGPVLNEIGKVVFVPKVQFFLSRLADPPTIQVKVNGQACKDGWSYDAPSNSIIFKETGPCMPQEGDKIWVHYKTLCLQS